MRAALDHLRESRIHDRLHDRLGDQWTIRIQRSVARPFRHNLTALAFIYWSDKAGQHRYTPHYQAHLGRLRRRSIRLLEIGIGGWDSPTWGGASLRMWRDYFRHGQIHGLDICEKRIDEPRLRVHQGDQSDGQFMRDFGQLYGPFDVIIDDGSHVSSHIITSFQALFDDALTAGGLYIIEDLHCAYDRAYTSASTGANSPTPTTSVDLIKELVDAVNLDPPRVRTMHLYRHIAFIQKGSASDAH